MPKNPLWDDSASDGPHPGYLGGLLEAQPILLREPNIVAFVTNVRAYPDGLRFQVVLEQAFDDGTLAAGPLSRQADIRVSVDLADGSTWRIGGNRAPACLVELGSRASFGDGGVSWSAEFWLPDLPPPGPVTFCLELAGHKGQGTIAGDDIRGAADKAIDLWS